MDFPDYFGNNWDAFWDCITDMANLEMKIDVLNFDVLKKISEKDSAIFIELMTDFKNYYNGEWAELKDKYFIHELGYMSNLCPNYEKAISKGLLFLKSSANEYGKKTIDAILSLCDRYLDEAIAKGREDIAKTLRNAPRYGAKSFREALQLFRILHFSLWLEGNYHVTVGRFDQYMLPYLENDIKTDVLDEEECVF